MNPEPFDDFFRQAPPSVNVEALRRDWLALTSAYDVNGWLLPLPPWACRPYEDSGPRAWDVLRHDLIHADPGGSMCVYLHVPFCSSKCGFCDSYSFKLGAHQTERIRNYVDRLCYELRLWSAQGNLRHRPISSVRLGGGTPTFLGEVDLTRLVECCKMCFGVSPTTEWALESTVESLTPGMIATMHDLGFRRLHIGVQSLQERARAEIGRRNPPADVLNRIAVTRERGWIVSVDLICGLPYQTPEGLIADIETLVEAGVNGFSLYELLIYPQNRRWAEKHGLTGRSHLPNYFMFLSGASVLEARGYHKNLFNHWADPLDANIYFTFPTRGEDLLAVGTIADGVFGDYHYRHPRYAAYLAGAHSGLPGLEGGLRRNAVEQRAKPLTTAILSSHVAAELTQVFQPPTAPGIGSLIQRWLDNALMRPGADDNLTLTPGGSWFAGNMIAEAACRIAELPPTSDK